MAARETCRDCGKRCKNFLKGWSCASRDKNAETWYLRNRRDKRTVEKKTGWLHVYAGLPYSRLFDTKKECLEDIAWKAGNSPLSRARRATITTVTAWR